MNFNWQKISLFSSVFKRKKERKKEKKEKWIVVKFACFTLIFKVIKMNFIKFLDLNFYSDFIITFVWKRGCSCGNTFMIIGDCWRPIQMVSNGFDNVFVCCEQSFSLFSPSKFIIFIFKVFGRNYFSKNLRDHPWLPVTQVVPLP